MKNPSSLHFPEIKTVNSLAYIPVDFSIYILAYISITIKWDCTIHIVF